MSQAKPLADLTRDELEEMVKDLSRDWKELAGIHAVLQEKHLKLQIDYVQSLEKRLDKYERRAGKKKTNHPKKKESLVCTPETDGGKGGAGNGI